MRFHHIIFAVIFFLALGSCYDEYEIMEEFVLPQEEDIFYDGDLVGRAMDEAGQPLEGVEVAYATGSEITAAQGIFHFAGLKLLHQGERLTIKMPSGFSYSHNAFPTFNDVNYTIAHCYTDREAHEANTSNFDVVFGDQTTFVGRDIQFLVDQRPYAGTISMEGYHLNMNDGKNQLYFPKARTTDNELFYLKMIDGVHFQWKTDDNRRLILANDQSIKVSISTSSAETDVFIFHFDERTSKWNRQNKPLFENNQYVFEVNADGYYCVAEAEKATHIDGNVLSNIQGVPNATIEIRNMDGELIDKTNSSASGLWHSVIPTSQRHTISVLSACHDELASMEIDPQIVGDSEIDFLVDNLQQFSGSAKSCDNLLLPGSILLSDGQYFLYLADGSFNYNLPLCNTSKINLSAYSINANKESAQLSWRPLASNNIQSLYICDVPKDNYIALRADGSMRYYEVTNTSLTVDSRISLTATDPADPDISFNIKMPLQNPGSVTTTLLNIVFRDSQLGDEGYTASCGSSTSGCGFEEFNINHVGDENGDWICGSFEGKFWMSTTNLNPNRAYNNRLIEGEFRIKRNF